MRPKMRITSATIRRAKTTILLIEHMRGGQPFNTDDIAHFLKMSCSGVRKYLKDMTEAGIVQSQYTGVPGTLTRTFWLIGDQAKIEAAVADLNNHTMTPEQIEAARLYAERRERIQNATLLPGTQVHRMRDDDVVPVRKVANARVRVQRDPLDEAFFGTGPARSVIIDQDMAEVQA